MKNTHIKTVAIIPARGGSKGIKNKNIIDFCGKPLIQHVIESCRKSSKIDLVCVSTDSELIKNTVNTIDSNVVIINRPKEISDDNATSETAIEHAILELEVKYPELEKVIFVQATSPLTTSNDFDILIDALDVNDSVAFYINDYGFFFDVHDMSTPRLPRQVRMPMKRECGNAWAFYKDSFLKSKSRLHGKIGLVELTFPKNLEIDILSDIVLLESIIKSDKPCI